MTYKEKKQYLLSFSKIEGRIRELEDEFEVLRNSATNISPNINGMPKCRGGVNKIEGAIERIERLENIIDKERYELETVKYNIMAAIGQLSDITERRIIHLKYIGAGEGKYHKAMTLWEIANKLGYSVDRINHIHGNALKKLNL